MSQIVSDTGTKVELIRQYRRVGEEARFVRGMYGAAAQAEVRLPDGAYRFTITAREIHLLLQEFPVDRVRDLFQRPNN